MCMSRSIRISPSHARPLPLLTSPSEFAGLGIVLARRNHIRFRTDLLPKRPADDIGATPIYHQSIVHESGLLKISLLACHAWVRVLTWKP